MSALSDPAVVATLDRLHEAARGDWKHFVGIVPTYLWARLTGRSFMEAISPDRMRDVYIPVTREEGRYLYVLARSIGARRIVEFGCSFGISTVYLAAAAKDTGGTVVTTEIEPGKVKATRDHLAQAGLADVATVLEGDALQTLKDVQGPIDLVFLDGWKNLYVPVLEELRPRLRPGAVVVGDNVDMDDCKPYIAHVERLGLSSALLFGGRMLVSITP